MASGCFSRIVAMAASPLSWLRTAITTSAPAPASASAVSRPRPVFDPVITATRPDWSGMSAVVQGVAVILVGSHVMVEIERVRRPFWAHQLVEYLLGIGLISAAVQMPQPAVPAVLGLVIILNAAIAKGAAGAFRLGRQASPQAARRRRDAAADRWGGATVGVDRQHQPVPARRGGIRAVVRVVPHRLHREGSSQSNERRQQCDAPRPTSEDIGRGAGRVVGGGVNSLKRWKDSFNSGADGDD